MQAKRSDTDDLEPGGAERPAHGSAPADDTDYEHRHFVNLLAIVFLLAIAATIIWTVRSIDESERLQRCINMGRRDCVKIDVAPSTAVRLPVR